MFYLLISSYLYFMGPANLFGHSHSRNRALCVTTHFVTFTVEFLMLKIVARRTQSSLNVSVLVRWFSNETGNNGTCHFFLIWRETSRCVPSIIYYISTVNTQRMQISDVLLQLGYIWGHVSAVSRPSSGQQRVILLRYSQIVVKLSNYKVTL